MANNLGVSSYTIGGDFDTWGAKYVADLAIFNKMAGDALAIPNTSGTVTLSVTDAQNFSLLANGATGSQVDIRVPDSIARFWLVQNSRASGSITVRCAAGGSVVILVAGEKRLVYSDGTNCVDLSLLSPAVATIAQIWGNTADKVIDTDGAWGSILPVNLGTFTGLCGLDFATFINAKVAFTGNVTFNLSTNNSKTGQSGLIEVTHSGGARTLTLNATYFGSANAAGIQLSTKGAGTKDILGYYISDGGVVMITPVALAVA